MKKYTHGGRRPNQTGRPAKPPTQKRVKVAITLPPDLYKKTAGGRSRIIEAALNKYFSTYQSYIMTHEQEWNQEVANQENWEREAYIRDLVNEDGQVYGRVYDRSKLTPVQQGILTYGPNGDWQRDVWEQIWFE